MKHPTRRGFLAASAAAVSSSLLAPVRAVAQAAKPVRISNVDIFPIEIPTPKREAEAGKYNQYTVVKVETDVGVRGYCFDRGWNDRLLEKQIRPALVGQDLFAIERHLKAGLVEWGGVEHAIWDAIGKIAGQPVYRLLGGSKTRLKVYVSILWKGPGDQSHISFPQQAENALLLKKAGFKGTKLRAFLPNPLDNAAVCGEMRKAVGPDFAIMMDRVAHLSGKVWDYDTALKVARGMEKHNVTWLEEPFDRADFLSPARLKREVDIPIAGAERYTGLDAYREVLVNDCFDIMQTDPTISGGIFTVVKVAALCQAFHKPLVLHGTMGLRLAGWLQASAAIGAEWQEFALMTPPMLPEEQWEPCLKVLNSKKVFTVEDGYVQVPSGPGLGMDVNEEAVQRYRGTKDRRFFPMYPELDDALKLT